MTDIDFLQPADGQELLAPEIRDQLGLMAFQPPTNAEELAKNRMIELPGLGSTEAVERTDVLVPAPEPVAARIHRPRNAKGLLPCIISIHGGGYVGGSQSQDDYLSELWVPTLNVVTVSIDYRLSPECPYPGPFEDCLAVIRWVKANADTLGIDPSRICLFGPSAGGGLAAGLTLRLRDVGNLDLAGLVLVAPMLDDRQLTVSSNLPSLAIWSKEANTFGWQSYLGALYGSDEVPCYAAAGRATDVRGLPPTLVTVGTADGFRDENVAFASLLAEQGVPVDLRMYAGAPHGYGLLNEWPVAVGASRDVMAWLANRLGRTLAISDETLMNSSATTSMLRAFAQNSMVTPPVAEPLTSD